jgi:aminoglycoside 6'-N-acetyltransferase I
LECWPDDDGYVGKLREIPGVFSQGETLIELEENILDAYELVIDAGEELSRSRMVIIRPARPGDAQTWSRLRHDLWPDGSPEEHAQEIEDFLTGRAREPLAALVAEGPQEEILGFAELSMRPSAEGCTTDRIGYLEGWYVVPGARGQGVGRALVEAALDWARAQGCLEFASDTEVVNEASTAAHRALGFDEVGLIRCFRKTLS